jgi:hypothetical protein
MFAYLPGADDPAVRASPRVRDDEILVANATQRPVSGFAMVVSLVPRFDHLIHKDEGSEAKIDAVLLEVALSLTFIPFKSVHDEMYT